MRVLLDTQVFLWANAAPERLGSARDLLEDAATERLVSAVSAWEIAIKVGIGRLPLPGHPARWVPDRIHALAALMVPIEVAHTLGVTDLPPIHRDPFDRLLVAQALSLDVPLVTADAVIRRYDVETIAVG